MKKLALSGLFLFSILSVFSQIGIGTTDPQETLHVAGTLRVDDMNSTGTATKLGGIDASGTFREILLDDTIDLTNNTLSAKGNKVNIGTVATTGYDQEDLDLLLEPGAANEKKGFIILTSNENNAVSLHSIKSANLEDGRKLIIFWKPIDNIDLKIFEEGTGDSQNRILDGDHGDFSLKKHGIVEMVYLANLSRWVILSFRI